MQHCVINIDITIIRFKLRNCEEKLLKMNSENKLRQSEKNVTFASREIREKLKQK